MLARAKLVEESEGRGKRGCVCEGVYLLRSITYLFAAVSEEAGVHVCELQLAVALKVDEAWCLPNGIVLRELEGAVRLVATAWRKGACGGAAPRRTLEDEVAAVVEDVSSLHATSMTKLEPAPHASDELTR